MIRSVSVAPNRAILRAHFFVQQNFADEDGTPRRYQELFERGKRKTTEGQFLNYRGGEHRPLINIKTPSYTQPEGSVLEALKKKFQEKLFDERLLDVD